MNTFPARAATSSFTRRSWESLTNDHSSETAIASTPAASRLSIAAIPSSS